MKRLTLYLAAAIIGALVYSTSMATDYQMSDSGLRDYDTTSDDGCGMNYGHCQETVKCSIGRIQSSPNGLNWDISGTLLWEAYADPTHSGTGSISGYVFAPEMVAHIQSGDFAGVPAMDVSFAGVTTDGSGAFSFSVPK